MTVQIIKLQHLTNTSTKQIIQKHLTFLMYKEHLHINLMTKFLPNVYKRSPYIMKFMHHFFYNLYIYLYHIVANDLAR